LATWYAQGGQLFNWFTIGASNYDTQYGTWGTTNDMFFPNSPKRQALSHVQISPLPTITSGLTLPNNNITGGHYLGSGNPNGMWQYMNAGNGVNYVLNSPTQYGAIYSLELYYDCGVVNSSLIMLLNNDKIFAVNLNNSGYGKYVWSPPFEITMGPALSVLQLQSTTPVHAPFDIATLKFTLVSVLTSPIPVNTTTCVNNGGTTSTGTSTSAHSTTTTGKVGAGSTLQINFIAIVLGALLMLLK